MKWFGISLADTQVLPRRYRLMAIAMMNEEIDALNKKSQG